MKTVAERLTWARKEAGLTQRALARLASVSPAYVSMVERGLFEVGAERGLRVSGVLGVPLRWLLLNDGAQPTPQTIKRAAREAQRRAA